MASPPSTLSRLARFAVMGGIGFALNIGITVGLHEGLGAPEELAFGIAPVVHGASGRIRDAREAAGGIMRIASPQPVVEEDLA